LIIHEMGQQHDELVWLRSTQQTGNIQAAQQIDDLQRQIAALHQAQQAGLTDLAKAQAEMEQLKRINAGYEQELARLRLEWQMAEKRVVLAQGVTGNQPALSLPDLVDPVTSSNRADPAEVDWLGAWSKSRTFARDSGFIQLLGESLDCRRDSLLKTFAARYGQEQLDQVGGTLKEMMKRLHEDLGLIDQIKVPGVQRGEPPSLVQLSAKGCAAFRFLVEREPLLGYETLRARHTNDQQVYLVLEAMDLLALERYTVDLLPTTTTLTAGGHFAPDMIAIRGHERICVEVETDAEYKNQSDRQKKWRIIAAGTGGQIYVVTRTAKTMHRLRGEIQDQRYGRTMTMRLTNLEQAREHYAQQNTIWVDERSVN
jgi:hypothetical protein